MTEPGDEKNSDQNDGLDEYYGPGDCDLTVLWHPQVPKASRKKLQYNIAIIKLKTGEDLIAMVFHYANETYFTTGTSILICRPFRISSMMVTQSVGPRLVKWLSSWLVEYSKNTMFLPLDMIVHIAQASPEMAGRFFETALEQDFILDQPELAEMINPPHTEGDPEMGSDPDYFDLGGDEMEF